MHDVDNIIGASMMGALWRNERGGALVIGAVALFVILATMGGGLDLGRAYLVRARLQQACDAGALTGRAELANATWESGPRAAADSMFNGNFPAGAYGAANLAVAWTATENGAQKTVSGTASADAPTSLTRIFGYRTIPVSASCQATIELSNTDVMFVLDTTESMGDPNPGEPTSKIVAMREAVKSFHATLEGMKSGNTAIRYGFVPYSENVNVGALLKREWMVDNWHYQSRRQDPVGPIPSYTTRTSRTITCSSGNYDLRTIYLIGDYAYLYSPSYCQNVASGNEPQTFTTKLPSESACTAPANTQTSAIGSPVTTNLTPTGGAYNAFLAWIDGILAASNGVRNGDVTLVKTSTITTINGSVYSASFVNGACTITETRYNNYILTSSSMTLTIPVKQEQVLSYTSVYWYYECLPSDNYSNSKTGTFNCLNNRVTPKVAGDFDGDVSWTKGSLANGLMGGGTHNYNVDTYWGSAPVSWPNCFEIGTGTLKGATCQTPNYRTWCIEERDTVKGTDYANALDMDIDLVPDPNDPSTQWRPSLPTLVAPRTGAYTLAPATWYTVTNTSSYGPVSWTGTFMNGAFAACPAPASKLAPRTALEISAYLATLAPTGQTYHDIGLIWGARLLSPTGIFKDENAQASNGGPITRHLIFMTDGEINTLLEHYDAYGVPALDQRRSNGMPTKAQQDAMVADRTAEMCRRIKAKGITLWVIAFGSDVTLSPLLENCASPGRAYRANDTTKLNQAFTQIAARIANLRITR